MDSEGRRSFVERIWQTEVLQSAVPDLIGVGGLVSIGAGVWQYGGAPATYIYGGVLAVVTSVLISVDRARKRAAETKQARE